MPRIYPLFSSSKGNSYYIGSSKSGILIDCGVSYSRLRRALDINGLSMEAVKAVFITHEHTDHISGLRVLAKNNDIPVCSRTETLRLLADRECINSETRCFNVESQSVKIGEILVNSFSISHDAVSPCGYRVTFDSGETCALCTDLGFVSDEVLAGLNGCSAVVLEANYDEEMLRLGSYPTELKRRIRSDQGHLSNRECGELAARLVAGGTTEIILGHLSQENNTPETARKTIENILADKGYICNRDYMLTCAPVETTGGHCHF